MCIGRKTIYHNVIILIILIIIMTVPFFVASVVLSGCFMKISPLFVCLFVQPSSPVTINSLLLLLLHNVLLVIIPVYHKNHNEHKV